MAIAATWTDDCQGKKDFDGPIISISTRYWPRGGGFSEIANGVWLENEDRPQIKPSATASIIVNLNGDDSDDLATKDFEGETFEVVKAAVESWANEQHARIVAAVRGLYQQ